MDLVPGLRIGKQAISASMINFMIREAETLMDEYMRNKWMSEYF